MSKSEKTCKKSKPTTDWETLTEPVALPLIKKFAVEGVASATISKAFAGSKYAGPFRTLVRENKAAKARTLAKRALSRRKLI
jgi:hypothetical protein